MRDYTKGPLIDKTRALMAQGLNLDELAASLGVSRRTAVDYRSRVRRADGLTRYGHKYKASKGSCRCGLRLYGNEEFPGRCYDCGSLGPMRIFVYTSSGLSASGLSPSLAASFREF